MGDSIADGVRAALESPPVTQVLTRFSGHTRSRANSDKLPDHQSHNHKIDFDIIKGLTPNGHLTGAAILHRLLGFSYPTVQRR